jgi:hypothetical protein
MRKLIKHPVWWYWPGRTLFLLLMILPLTTSAMSAGKMIVDEAIDASDANTMQLELKFVMRVNYLWYFPHALNTQFLIAVQPVNGLANYDLGMREHIRIPPDLENVISDLYYDGTEANNRFIVLKTSRKVGIEVKPGQDGRTITIEFKSVSPRPASDCNGSSDKSKE